MRRPYEILRRKTASRLPKSMAGGIIQYGAKGWPRRCVCKRTPTIGDQ